MPSLDRRTIAELVTLYELEPTVRDVFVEGPIDRAFYEWYLATAGCEFDQVLPIDRIDVGREFCEKYGLTVGNRSELVAAALEVSARLPGHDTQSTYIADSDLEVHDWPWSDCAALLRTDFPAIESYGFTKEIIRKVVALFLPTHRTRESDLFHAFRTILDRAFVVRIVNARPHWCCRWFSVADSCEVQRGLPILDEEDLVVRLLNASGRRGDLAGFQAEVEEVDIPAGASAQAHVYGRDFVDLLSWYVRTRSRGTRCSAEEAQRAVLLAITEDELNVHELFRALRHRLVA